jgi:hypothetical protein
VLLAGEDVELYIHARVPGVPGEPHAIIMALPGKTRQSDEWQAAIGY